MTPNKTDQNQSQPLLLASPHQCSAEAPSNHESLVREMPVRARLLDGSKILPGEVSFATVKLNQGRASSTYSPAKEFLVKATSRGKLMIVILGLLLIGGGMTFLHFKGLPVRILSNADITADSPVAPPVVETRSKETNPPAQDSSSSISSERVNQPAPPATSDANGQGTITESATLPEASVPAGIAQAPSKRSFKKPGVQSDIADNSQPKDAIRVHSESASMSGDKRRREVEAELSPAPKTTEGERRASVVAKPDSSPASSANGSSVPKSTNSKPKVIPWP